MKKGIKALLLGLAATLIVIQFFRPEKNDDPLDPDTDMLALTSPPEELAHLIRVSCYDCHSNQTVYPWYSQIAPVSWFLNKHVVDGKEDLNASDYGNMDKADKIKLLTDFYDVVEAGSMPMASYMLLHKEARLSEEDKKTLMVWSEAEALKVMRE